MVRTDRGDPGVHIVLTPGGRYVREVSVVDRVLSLHSGLVYLVVGLLVFAEDALFVGFVIPGETAAILGGVAASRGQVSVVLMCVVVVLAAIVGDTVGYEIGARYGVRVLSVPALRRRERQVASAEETLARRGGVAVFVARFIAFLRAVMPFLAGLSHMRYRRFLVYNAAGGLIWGVGSVLLGYLAGNSYSRIEKLFGRGVALVVGGLVIVALVVWTIRRRRRERANRTPPPT
jgi:membrane protein DedA with SNARE-associated domain